MSTEKEIAVYLMYLLLKQKRPLTFTEVCNSIRIKFKDAFQSSGLSDFLGNLPSHFREYDIGGQVFVKLVTTLSICETHCSRNETCDSGSNCTGLHVCKFYALEGKCDFGLHCRFGHDLTTAHNSRILRKALLYDSVRLEDVRYLLNLLENRTIVSTPKICKFYNKAEGCRQSDTGKCPFIHMCIYYIQGNCRFNRACSRNHDIDENVKTILQKHGIDTAKSVKALLSELRALYGTSGDHDDNEVADDKGNGNRFYAAKTR
ncbi:MAG: hypothetical protein AB2693_32940 [Candidatus Thiodiazotropha sp.]